MSGGCFDCCFTKIYTRVEDTETLVNYKYVKTDCKIDTMFGGKTFTFPCMDYILYYECPHIRRVKYFCRLLNVSRLCYNNRDASVVHRLCITTVVFDVVNAVHVTFRVAIDISGNQYTNGVSIPLVHLEEIECLGLLLSLHRKEAYIAKTRQVIQSLYNLVLERFNEDIYETQKLCFEKFIYCPLRFISIFNFYYKYRLNIVNAIVDTCICKRYITTYICPKNIYFNRMLVEALN